MPDYRAFARTALGLMILAGSASTCYGPVAATGAGGALPSAESLHYRAEWRLFHAGNVALDWQAGPDTDSWQLNLRLESVGLISKLYPIRNDYRARLTDVLCAENTLLVAHEGKRHRETRVTYDGSQRKAFSQVLDLELNKVVNSDAVTIPPCVHDVMGALYKLRTLQVPLGSAVEIPISDGKKNVSARVEAQRKETIRTPSGRYETVRYEAFLFRNVLYRRDARLYVWLSNDERRLPVQVTVQMPFYIGTVTVQLAKIGKS